MFPVSTDAPSVRERLLDGNGLQLQLGANPQMHPWKDAGSLLAWNDGKLAFTLMLPVVFCG